MRFCPTCGARLEPDVRFCAGCGEAVRSQMPMTQELARPVSHRSAPSAPASPRATEVRSPEAGSAGHTVKIIAAVVALAILAAVGWVASSSLRSGSVQGASSPTAAVQRLLDAITKKDPIALVDSLEPAETSDLSAVVTKARTISAAHGSSQVGHEFDGVTVTLSNEAFAETKLSKRVAQVAVAAGDATVQIDHGALSRLLRSLIPRNYSGGRYDAGQVQAKSPFALALMTVNDGNGWFVSPIYTALASVAKRDHVAIAYSDTMSKSVTQKTPRDAAEAFVTALGSGPGWYAAAAPLLVPGEQQALQDFAPLWQSWVAARSSAMPTAQTLLGSPRVIDLAAGQRGVVVDSATGSWSDPQAGRAGSFSLVGQQLSVTDQTTGDAPFESSFSQWFHLPTSGTERLVIDAVPVDGGYAVSLVGTVAATLSTVGDDEPIMDKAFGAINQGQPRG